MIIIRSILFNFALYLFMLVVMTSYLPLLLLWRKLLSLGAKFWSFGIMFILKNIAGIDIEIRGQNRLPNSPRFVACKHQSMWETIVFFMLLKDLAIVLKKELLYVPLLGWLTAKNRMIFINRKGGVRALREMVSKARKRMRETRDIVIFPEGTRSEPGKKKPYQTGVAALYAQLKVPCVPVALNSGLFWPRRKFMRYPGTIILEFLDPIMPGLNSKVFMKTLEKRIESATDLLIAEAEAKEEAKAEAKAENKLKTKLKK